VITEILFDYNELFPTREAHPATFHQRLDREAKVLSSTAISEPEPDVSPASRALASPAASVSTDCVAMKNFRLGARENEKARACRHFYQFKTRFADE
jgi:hypothetical protein